VTIKQFFQVQGKQREEGHPTELDPQDPVSKKKKQDGGWLGREKGWGFSSVVENLPSMYEVLGLIPNTGKNKNKNCQFSFQSFNAARH
jgi:hypothetical protein